VPLKERGVGEGQFVAEGEEEGVERGAGPVWQAWLRFWNLRVAQFQAHQPL